jgi:cell division septation protein DedD
LLTKREGLVVPGLGSFISEFQPASIRQDKKMIHPPRKQFRFDPTVKEDADNVLASGIARQKEMDLEEAVKEIEQFTDEVKKQLEDQGSYELRGLGMLEKKPGGVIDLKQAETEEADLGFEAIAAEPFELETPPKQPRKTTAPSTPPPPPVKKRSRRKSTIWLTILAVFLLLIGYAGWYTGFYDYVLRQWKQRQQTSQATTPPTRKQPQTQEQQPASSDDKIDRALDRMTDKKQALMYKEEKDTSTYYLVAGSFKKYENAQEFVGQLREKGYSPDILEKDNLFRVTIQTFDKKQDALVKLYQVRDTGQLKSIWLLSVREKDR